MNNTLGVDVSKWQSAIDWEKAKAQIGFSIVRATSGRSIDSRAHNNLSELNRQNIPCGVYSFSYAVDEKTAVKEAESVLAFVRAFKLEYPIFFDWEYDSETFMKKKGIPFSNARLRGITKAFCDAIEKAGYFAGVYANKDFFNRYGVDFFKRYALWYAHWNTSAAIPPEAKLWQFSNKSHIAGITTEVDTNIDLVDFPHIIKTAKLNHLGGV